MRFLTLSPDQVLPPLVPMRDGGEDDGLEELTRDIRAHGVRVPISVVPVGDKYRVVAGHRRWMAAQHAGLAELPVVVKELDEEGEVGEMLAENLHRKAPNPLEEARVFAIFQEATGRTVAEVAEHVKKSPQYVGNRLRILHGPDDLKQALRDGLINLSVALELERCTHDADRQFLLSHAISGGATAATVSRWVRDQAAQRAFTDSQQGGPGEVVQIIQQQVMTCVCEWHRGTIELERSLSFRVCGDCYQDLLKIREAAFSPQLPAPAPPPLPAPPALRHFAVIYRAPWTSGEEVSQRVSAHTVDHAAEVLARAFEVMHPGQGFEVIGVRPEG